MNLEALEIKGLSEKEVIESRLKHGRNAITKKKVHPFASIIGSILSDPMIILLMIAACIYLISGHLGDAVFMFAAIVFVATISIYQDRRSNNALNKLEQLSKPNCKAIRNGKVEKIKTDDLVVGDVFIVEEGDIISADAYVIKSHDLSVDESLLTGESQGVFKSDDGDKVLYQGTQVTSGMGVCTVYAVGTTTRMGKIGKTMDELPDDPSPMETRIMRFVKSMIIIGSLFFLIVWYLNYLKSEDILDSLLKALTLAMSILPEEIPVAFTTFMAIGSFRLLKLGIIPKQMKTIESLGMANVICLDKTGTLTLNQMTLKKLFTTNSMSLTDVADTFSKDDTELLAYAMWSSEPYPFDPMEKSIHKIYEEKSRTDDRLGFKMIHEYPLEGNPPMMTHIYEDHKGSRIIAAKGGLETMIDRCNLNEDIAREILLKGEFLSIEGYRILGVAKGEWGEKPFPENQEEINFRFLGIIAFLDPPKANMKEVIQQFHDAGVETKIITGDNENTTLAVAKKLGWKEDISKISGQSVMSMDEESTGKVVSKNTLFYRMYPEAKLKVIEAIKRAGSIVAMTGDGVNDGPALKAAHIGIAMGQRGTELAKSSASLVLQDDDLSKMVQGIAMGRRIHSNLKKAIRYIISIHIPIILIVAIPLILGWVFPHLFSPVHVITLELIMGPTCSIIFENEPIEPELMSRPPENYSNNFFSRNELIGSTVQGLVIALGVLMLYQVMVYNGSDEKTVRTMVFSTLIISNILLTLVNRSFHAYFIETIQYKNNLMRGMLLLTLSLLVLMLTIPFIRSFYEFTNIGLSEILLCLAFGSVSVLWYELFKWIKRRTYFN